MTQKKMTILGAGLVGSLLAILMKKKGFDVSLLERRGDIRKGLAAAGKSINLAMSVRGWKALELAGLRKDIEEIAIPMYGRCIHHPDSSTVYQPYGKNNEAIYSVSRGELNKRLMSLAEKEGVTISFNQKILDVNIDQNHLTIEDAESNETSIKTDTGIIISADGAFSSLRNAYTKRDRYNYQQFYIEHGYKELEIPAGEDGRFLLEKNALHIWPRKNFMLIALPNNDATFTCTLFLPFEGPQSFATLNTPEQIEAFMTENFPDAVTLMPDYINLFQKNPTSSLVIVRCHPWSYQDKSMLIGDAAHAIVPFYGQGMNCGFEDCSVLMEIMDEVGDDWESIFKRYEKARKPNGDAVADLALINFIEMRDLVADPVFLERKKIEKQLGLLFPQRFNSVYEMVSFSHTPYSYALHCLKAQDVLLGEIMQEGNFDTNMLNESFKLQLEVWMTEYEEKVGEMTA